MFRQVFTGFLKGCVSTKTKSLEFHSLYDRRFIFHNEDKFASYAIGKLWKSNVFQRADFTVLSSNRNIASENETDTSSFASNKNVNFSETTTEITSGSNCVFMRGLPYSATKDDIIKFFSPLGISPTKITLKQDRFGVTNGKAEVEFETSEECFKALKKQNHYIGQRYIELAMNPFPQMNAERFNIRHQGAGISHTQNPFAGELPRHVVKITGMPYSTNSDDIYKFFQPLNVVPIGIDLKFSPDGYPLGFCYVKFRTHADALHALKNDNKYIGDRYVRISLMGSPQGRTQYSGDTHDHNENFRNSDQM